MKTILKVAFAVLMFASIACIASAQAPPKTKSSAKPGQPMYVITAHKVIFDDRTDSQLDNYTVVYGSEVLRVQYAESQIDARASELEQVSPGKNLHWHTRYGRYPQLPDVSQVPQVGVSIRACNNTDTSPCMSRNGDTLHYEGLKTYDYVNFDILEEREASGRGAGAH